MISNGKVRRRKKSVRSEADGTNATQSTASTSAFAGKNTTIGKLLKPLWKHIVPDDYLPARDGDTVSQEAVIVHIGQLFAVLVTASYDFAILCARDDPERFHHSSAFYVGSLWEMQFKVVENFDESRHVCKYIFVDGHRKSASSNLSDHKHIETITAAAVKFVRWTTSIPDLVPSSSPDVTEIERLRRRLQRYLKQKAGRYEFYCAAIDAIEQSDETDTPTGNTVTTDISDIGTAPVERLIAKRVRQLTVVAAVLVIAQVVILGAIVAPLKAVDLSLETLPYIEVVEVSVAIAFLKKLKQRKDSIAYTVAMILDILGRHVVFGYYVFTGATIETKDIVSFVLHVVSYLVILVVLGLRYHYTRDFKKATENYPRELEDGTSPASALVHDKPL
ncbi:hypothetical protein AAVH_14069 [Aphelenchoides avenae]|nr:hypothetical protein AAVH_14069 [Aphelenchus avenae]